MRVPTMSRYACVLILLTLFVGSIASATELVWLSGLCKPVRNVTFYCVSTCNARITDTLLVKYKLPQITCTDLKDSKTTAWVNCEKISFNCIELTDCRGTYVTIKICEAPLCCDLLGSAYKSDVKIDVCTPCEKYCVSGTICGRIRECDGKYYLSGDISGCTTIKKSCGDTLIHTIRLRLSGDTAVNAPS